MGSHQGHNSLSLRRPQLDDAIFWVQFAVDEYFGKNVPSRIGSIHHNIQTCRGQIKVITTLTKRNGSIKTGMTAFDQNSTWFWIQEWTNVHCKDCMRIWFPMSEPNEDEPH